MNLIQTHRSPNYTPQRLGYAPSVIVNHITAGLMPGCLQWLCNPVAQVSSHYLVTKAGTVYQLVQDENTAWTCGDVESPTWPLYQIGMNPNTISLNIEHEAISPWDALTEQQYQASLALHHMLCNKHHIPRDNMHIIGHSALNTRNRAFDPGPLFPWERLFSDLNREVRIRFNGAWIETDTLMEQGRTMVPIRFVEHLGYTVHWDGQSKTIDIWPEHSSGY